MFDITTRDVLVGLVVVRARGTLTRADYRHLTEEVDRLVALHGPIDLIVDLTEDFDGWEPTALLSDLKFDATRQSALRRVAIVGDANWQKAGTTLSAPFFKPPVRWFDTVEAARGWFTGEIDSTDQ